MLELTCSQAPWRTPKEDTWQVLGKLVQNAFFKAILPGFEKTVPADNCHVNDRSVFLLILCR